MTKKKEPESTNLLEKKLISNFNSLLCLIFYSRNNLYEPFLLCLMFLQSKIGLNFLSLRNRIGILILHSSVKKSNLVFLCH